ncbi:MAG: hypothetical protein QXU79_04410 [Candidatus Micrarchaeaceae archaeon]
MTRYFATSSPPGEWQETIRKHPSADHPSIWTLSQPVNETCTLRPLPTSKIGMRTSSLEEGGNWAGTMSGPLQERARGVVLAVGRGVAVHQGIRVSVLVSKGMGVVEGRGEDVGVAVIAMGFRIVGERRSVGANVG